MAIERHITIIVNDADLLKLEGDLTNIGAKFETTSLSAEKVGEAVSESSKKGAVDMRTLDAVTGGYASKVDRATKSVKGFNLGLKGTKAAILATGIGVFIILLGELIANWDKVSQYITASGRALKSYNDEIAILKQNTDVIDAQIKFMDKQIELLERQGLNAEAIKTQRAQKLYALQQEYELQVNTAKIELERLKTESTRYSFSNLFLGTKQKASQEQLDAIALQDKKVADLNTKLEQAKINIDKLNDPLTVNIPTPKKDKKGFSGKEGTAIDGATDDGLEGLKARTNAMAEFAEVALSDEFEMLNSQKNMIARLEEDAKNNSIRIEKEKTAAKLDLYKLVGGGLSSLGTLIGEETTAGKAFAVAGTLFSTYSAAQKAYESQLTLTPDSPIRAAIAAASAVAQGLARVKAIMAVKTPGSVGGYVPTTSIAQAPSIPQFNVVGNSPINQLADTLKNSAKTPVKAYVVEKEVRNANELGRNIEETASVG